MYHIGEMPMPADFKYRDVYLKGRPHHERFDDFSIRHPKMDTGKRAKIFAPFDALRGFNFAISRKDVRYENKPELSREEELELDRRLDRLHSLTYNSRLARINRPCITVSFFLPCNDSDHEAFNQQGKVKTITGVCQIVDSEITRTIRVDDTMIPFDQLLKIDCGRNPFVTDSVFDTMEGA